MDLDLLRARQPESQSKKAINSLRAILLPNLILGMYMQTASPKVEIDLITTSLTILLIISGINQSISSSQPL